MCGNGAPAEATFGFVRKASGLQSGYCIDGAPFGCDGGSVSRPAEVALWIHSTLALDLLRHFIIDIARR